VSAPLIGRNSSVSYDGHEYHVQTEDSVHPQPQVVTHLFGDGGRIIATRRTGYAEHVGTPLHSELVKRLIAAQHRQMLSDVRAGRYRCDAPPGRPVHEEPPLELRPLVDAAEVALRTGPRPAEDPPPGPPDARSGRSRDRSVLSDALAADDPTTGDLDELMIRQVLEHLARAR